MLPDLNQINLISDDDLLYVVDVDDVSGGASGTSKNVTKEGVLSLYDFTSISDIGTITSGEWNATPISGGYVGEHASTHTLSGSDTIALDELGSPADNTNLDVSISGHGLLPKYPSGTYNYFNSTGEWEPIDNNIPSGYILIETNKNTGTMSFDVCSSTGYIAVQWWDNDVDIFGAGSSTSNYTASKAIPTYPSDWSGNTNKNIYIWSCTDAADSSQSGELIAFESTSYTDIFNCELGYCPSLERLYILYDNLTKIETTNAPNLERLYLYKNYDLDTIEVSHLDSLSYLNFSFCPSTNLLIKNPSDLLYFYAWDTNFSSVDFTGYDDLRILNVSGNDYLTSITTNSTLHRLIRFYANGCNSLDSFDFSNMPNLLILKILNNPQITEISLSGLSSLEDFDCSACSLTSLVLPPGNLFVDLCATNNNLSSVNANGSVIDEGSYCDISSNNMSASALNDFFASLGEANGSAILEISDNPGSETCDTSIAEDNGYIVFV